MLNTYKYTVDEKEYLFSGSTGVITELDSEVQSFLDTPHAEMDKDGECYKYLFGATYVQPKIEGKIPVKSLSLFVTHKCNLTCDYCYHNANKVLDGSEIDIDKVMDTIRTIGETYGFGKKLSISFFGGEPMMNFRGIEKVMDAIDAYAEEKDIKVNYGATTNMTIISDEMIKTLEKRNFSLVISFDGTKEQHDKFRTFKNGKGSYDLIVKNAARLSNKKIPVTARITMAADEKLFDFISLYKELRNVGFPRLNITFIAEDYTKTDSSIVDALREGLEKMSDFIYESTKKREVVKFVNMVNPFKVIHKGLRAPRKFPCGAGRGYLTISGEGDIYLCQRFINEDKVCFYRHGEDLDEKIRLQFLEENSVDNRGKTKDDCETCWIKNYCAGDCYHHAYVGDEKFDGTSGLHCLFRKLIYETTVKLYTRMTPEEREWYASKA